MRALALRTPAWAMRWLIFNCSAERVTLPGSGGLRRGGMVVVLAGGSGVGGLGQDLEAVEELALGHLAGADVAAGQAGLEAVGDAGGPADGGLVDALVDQQLGGAEGEGVARAAAARVNDRGRVGRGGRGQRGGRRGAGDAGPQLGRPHRVAAQVAGLKAAVEARLHGVEAPDGGLADALVDAQLGARSA